MDNNSTDRALENGSELLCYETSDRAAYPDFDSDKNILFVHGFTAHGGYMDRFAKYFNRNGLQSFIYNYNSYNGLEAPAKTLLEILELLNEVGSGILEKKKIVLVGHSMGGLVLRSFAYLPQSEKYIKGIVTLGTPHSGTLGDDSLIDIVVSVGEYISTAMPHFTNKDVLSIKDLTGKTEAISNLMKENEAFRKIPFLSVSGAKKEMNYGGFLKNRIMRSRIKKAFGDEVHDGLVIEKSSDATIAIPHVIGPDATHLNDYNEYYMINHTNLVVNHSLSLEIIKWINKLA